MDKQISREDNRKYRVLIVENDPEYKQDHIKNIAVDWGYTTVVAEGQGPALLEDAKKQAKRHRCHACVVDMRLIDDKDRTDSQGLVLAKALLPARSLICTAYGNNHLTNQVHADGIAVALVGKEDGPNALQYWLDKSLEAFQHPHKHAIPKELLDQNLVTKLRFSDNDEDTIEEINLVLSDICRELFPQAETVSIESLPNSTDSLSPHTQAIRHRSVVVKAMARGFQPMAIKLTSRSRIEQEVERYNQHIRHKLRGHFHATLESTFYFWNVGGNAYNFLGEAHHQQLFTTFYKTTTAPQAIFTPIQHLLGDVWRDLYSVREPLQESLFDSYEKLRLRPGKRQGPLRRRFPAWYHVPEQIAFPHLRGQFPDPRPWICKRHEQSHLVNAESCVVHGDLHADNIFVNAQHAWVIDFERTDHAHVLSDFAELEQDVITRLSGFVEADNRLIYELAIALTAPDTPAEPLRSTTGIEAHPNALKAFKVICHLRGLAHDLTQFRDQREYYWALLLDCLYAITKLENPANGPAQPGHRLNTTLLLASVLCQRLDEGVSQMNWPIKSWPSVTFIEPTAETDNAPLLTKIHRAVLRIGARVETQTALISALDDNQKAEITLASLAIEQDRLSRQEVEQILQDMQLYLNDMAGRSDALENAVAEAIQHSARIVNDTELEPKHRIIATLPIIPMLIDYQAEFELKSGINVTEIISNLINRFPRF